MAFEIYREICLRTPVDTGRARGNWNISVGEVDKNIYDYANAPRFNSEEDIGNVDGDTPIFISNNLPYINKLEYGGYPDPPKKGSGKTVHGFSRQAPQGMVGVTMAHADVIVKKACEDFDKGLI